MKINIGGNTDAKQETLSLADQVKQHQFKQPVVEAATATSKPNNAAISNPQPAKQSGRIAIGQQANQPDANGIPIGKQPEVKPEIAPQPSNTSTAIPEMSDDKYEVVLGADDGFSEASGNKFEEQLGILQSAIDGVGDLKDSMVNVLTFLDDNPEYKDNIAPKDIAVFISACRKTAGIVVTEKKTRKTSKKKTSELENDIMADLANLDLDLGI